MVGTSSMHGAHTRDHTPRSYTDRPKMHPEALLPDAFGSKASIFDGLTDEDMALRESKSAIPCRVRKLLVVVVTLRINSANNGEVLAGVLYSRENVERKIIPWEVVS